MGSAVAVLLAAGPKGFFENPGYLIGLPLLILGAIGALIALTPLEIRWPVRQAPRGGAKPGGGAAAQGPPAAVDEAGAPGHPTATAYIRVGVVLAVATLLEVAVYYVDMADGAQLGIMLAMMLLDFALVALWFMHLRFDSRLFSALFAGGLALGVALFVVVLATLGANLV